MLMTKRAQKHPATVVPGDASPSQYNYNLYYSGIATEY